MAGLSTGSRKRGYIEEEGGDAQSRDALGPPARLPHKRQKLFKRKLAHSGGDNDLPSREDAQFTGIAAVSAPGYQQPPTRGYVSEDPLLIKSIESENRKGQNGTLASVGQRNAVLPSTPLVIRLK